MAVGREARRVPLGRAVPAGGHHGHGGEQAAVAGQVDRAGPGAGGCGRSGDSRSSACRATGRRRLARVRRAARRTWPSSDSPSPRCPASSSSSQIQSRVRRMVARSTPGPGSMPSAPVTEGWSRAHGVGEAVRRGLGKEVFAVARRAVPTARQDRSQRGSRARPSRSATLGGLEAPAPVGQLEGGVEGACPWEDLLRALERRPSTNAAPASSQDA